MAGVKPIVSKDRAVRYASTYPENEPLYEWLRKETPEEVLEPDLPIIDPHFHLWDLRGGPLFKNWKQKVYKLPEILEDVNDGHNVVKTVFTQAVTFYHGKGVTGLPEIYRALGEVE